jgi:predicted hydrolase (HD superfamily)
MENTGAKTGHSRESAWGLLTEFTQSESLRKHAMAVEACMVAYAERYAREHNLGEDEARELREKYSVTGLLHDFDYEKYPSAEEHPFVGSKILAERGWPEDVRRAILSHANYSGVSRDSHMEKALFACDELAGFITATALVKPSKSIQEVDAKSIRKKMKDKAFARSVSREDIVNGAAELGLDLDEHITFCIEAMKQVADKLGIAGTGDAVPAQSTQ